nr:PREDICTED: uncharacterized protein LOC103278354 [Anolis carolinensis]|eukprot:XP_008105639.1 PREDICTED: uncharacterized protein LOC103278354 [Anolis carolinensis]
MEKLTLIMRRQNEKQTKRIEALFADQTRELEMRFDQKIKDTVSKFESLKCKRNNELWKCLKLLKKIHQNNCKLYVKSTRTILNNRISYKGKKEIKLSEIEKQLIYIKDAQRRNNFILKNWPESERNEWNGSLAEEILKWLQRVTPMQNWTEMDIQRTHRLPGGRSKAMPRDIIVKVTHYKKKEQLMAILRKEPERLRSGGVNLQIYNDFCAETKSWRQSMKPCTVYLRDKEIHYHWGYPVHLNFFFKGKKYKIDSQRQGFQLLKELGICKDKSEAETNARKAKEGKEEGGKGKGKGEGGGKGELIGAVGGQD